MRYFSPGDEGNGQTGGGRGGGRREQKKLCAERKGEHKNKSPLPPFRSVDLTTGGYRKEGTKKDKLRPREKKGGSPKEGGREESPFVLRTPPTKECRKKKRKCARDRSESGDEEKERRGVGGL